MKLEWQMGSFGKITFSFVPFYGTRENGELAIENQRNTGFPGFLAIDAHGIDAGQGIGCDSSIESVPPTSERDR